MRYSGIRYLSKLRSFWLNKWNAAGVGDGELSFKEIHSLLAKKCKLSLPELNRLCYQRFNRMPLQYVIGEWDFRSLTLKTQKPVFIPRPETEQLAGLVIEFVNNFKSTATIEILEIGCGTGAISLAIADECSNTKITAIDKNPLACNLAKTNAELLNLPIDVHEATLTKGGVIANLPIANQFDVIVSNPPYLTDEEMTTLQPEIILYEASDALHGGKDGLDVVDDIISFSSQNLKTGGVVFLEVGLSHPNDIKQRLNDRTYPSNLKFVSSFRDFTERHRFVQIRKGS